MTRDQRNTVEMWRAVTKVMDQYSGTWTGIPGIATAVSGLKNLVARAAGAGTVQLRPTSGATDRREAAETAMVDAVLDLAAAARAYAIDRADQDLYARVAIYTTEFNRLPALDKGNKAQDVLDAIGPVSSLLAPYGVTAGEVVAASAALAAYQAEIRGSRNLIATRMTATASMPELVQEGRTLLEKLDGLMRRLRRTAPGFASNYRFARIIVDNAGRTEEEETP